MGHETSTPSRMVELDALRGIAAVAVLGYHFTTRYQEQIGHVGGMPVDLLAGKYGVYLFFLISGFVIFMTLERTRTAADFVVSRFSRLFPAYWVSRHPQLFKHRSVREAGLSQRFPLQIVVRIRTIAGEPHGLVKFFTGNRRDGHPAHVWL